MGNLSGWEAAGDSRQRRVDQRGQVGDCTEPTLNQNGFESYAEFDVVGTDGTTNRIVLFSFYRITRTVIVTVLDYAGLSEADFTTFQNDAYKLS